MKAICLSMLLVFPCYLQAGSVKLREHGFPIKTTIVESKSYPSETPAKHLVTAIKLEVKNLDEEGLMGFEILVKSSSAGEEGRNSVGEHRYFIYPAQKLVISDESRVFTLIVGDKFGGTTEHEVIFNSVLFVDGKSFGHRHPFVGEYKGLLDSQIRELTRRTQEQKNPILLLRLEELKLISGRLRTVDMEAKKKALETP